MFIRCLCGSIQLYVRKTFEEHYDIFCAVCGLFVDDFNVITRTSELVAKLTNKEIE